MHFFELLVSLTPFWFAHCVFNGNFVLFLLYRSAVAFAVKRTFAIRLTCA